MHLLEVRHTFAEAEPKYTCTHIYLAKDMFFVHGFDYSEVQSIVPKKKKIKINPWCHISSRIPQWNKINGCVLHHLFPNCGDMYLCPPSYQNQNSILKGNNNETSIKWKTTNEWTLMPRQDLSQRSVFSTCWYTFIVLYQIAWKTPKSKDTNN